VCLSDGACDRQAYSQILLLGRKEWVEDLLWLFRRYSGPNSEIEVTADSVILILFLAITVRPQGIATIAFMLFKIKFIVVCCD
jgi:hypothetical protein